MHHICSSRYHADHLNKVGASILFVWLCQKDNLEPVRIAPLCEFGGGSFKAVPFNQSACGTYAVCPSPDCLSVNRGGYSDTDGLVPKQCRICQTPFSYSDYFQPVYGEKSDYDPFKIKEAL